MSDSSNSESAYRFQINLKGMIQLLSDHLYSSPDVFLRELLQNSVDAMNMRMNDCLEFFDPEVRVEVIEEQQLIITDSGIGLDEYEIHRFLATIGQSIKRDITVQENDHHNHTHQKSSSDYLGQFGIGLLACFMVSNEIEVYTRSARTSNAPVLRWLGRADGTYDVSEVDRDMEPGTQVHLKAKKGKESHFRSNYVKDRLRHFGRFLSSPILLITPDDIQTINSEPIWEQDLDDEEWREETLELGREIFQENFTDVIPLHSEVGGVNGVAFVIEHQAKSSNKRQDHVYLKGMLLSDKMDHLLPHWAFFTRAIMNTQNLHPVASREAFVEGEHLTQTRQDLAQCLRSYLRELASEHPDQFQTFLETHYYALKHLCAEDHEFLELIGPWLPFETSSGRMNLKECTERCQGMLFYAPTIDQFRELSTLAEAQGITLINAGYSYDFLILQAYTRQRSLELIPLNSEALISQMSALSTFDEQLVNPVLEVAREVLERFNCQVSFKSFEPASVPALYGLDQLGRRMRQIETIAEESNDLFRDVLNDLSSAVEFQGAARPHFIINYKNSIAQTLPLIQDKQKLQRLIEVLYVQTLLLGHHAMNEREMSLISESLTGLMMLSIDLH